MKKQSFLSLLLLVLAVVFGADTAMAMADASGAVPDDKGLNTDLTGSAASGTQVREGELAEHEIDSIIAKFRPYLFPLDTDIRRDARQSKVKGYEIEHYASGSANVNCELTAAVANNTAKAASVTIAVADEDKAMFAVGSTVSVEDVDGYAEDGITVSGNLMLLVTAKTASAITVEALNGPLSDEKKMYVPDIPVGSNLVICANACAESQMIVAPENYQPRPKMVFLQKKIGNIVFTDHFKEIIKKVPFIEQDLRENALYNFRRKAARTAWIGVKSKRKVYVNDTMGYQFVYTSEGVIPQIKSFYGIAEALKYEDLVGICKMQFTSYSANNEANVYCGKNFMEKLLNIDYTKHKDIQFTTETVLGIKIRSFVSTFGTLYFKYDPTLDDCGYADYATVLDIKNAVRYVQRDEKTDEIDMSKAGDNSQEAKREIWSQIDAIALKGYNAILVGPSSKLLGRASSGGSITASSLAALPDSPVDNQIVYLTADNGGWAAGSLVQYNKSLGAWVEYQGVIQA